MSALGINIADIIILVIILFSILISLFRGFVREALSLVSWILAFWLALTFHHEISELLTPYIQSPTLRIAAAFIAIFIAVLIICGIINYLISTIVEKTGLSSTDRLLGMIFGLIRGVLLISALLLMAQLTTPMAEENWWKQAKLIQYFEPVEVWLQGFIPENLSSNFKLSEQ